MIGHLGKGLLHFVKGDGTADGVVPRGGQSPVSVGFLAATMAFFAVLVLALGLAAGRLATTWGDTLAQNGTLQILAPPGAVEAQARAALNVLRTTPGVRSVRVIEVEEQVALLEPWLGTDAGFEGLPLPLLIEVISDRAALDLESLTLRLEAEAPGAVFDDHAAWRQPLVETAHRLRIFAAGALGLMVLALAAILTLAARAATAANRPVIQTLRLIGARDGYVCRAFTRQFTLQALGGAAVGTALAMILLALLPQASEQGFFLVGIGLQGWHWILPALVPLISALTAYLATQRAARRMLMRWS